MRITMIDYVIFIGIIYIFFFFCDFNHRNTPDGQRRRSSLEAEGESECADFNARDPGKAHSASPLLLFFPFLFISLSRLRMF